MPQPQQCQIRATSATYTTAHSNTGSLTQWTRTGIIEPETSCFLVGFVSMTETPLFPFFFFFNSWGGSLNWFHVPLMSPNWHFDKNCSRFQINFSHYFGSTVFQEFREIIESVGFKLFNWIWLLLPHKGNGWEQQTLENPAMIPKALVWLFKKQLL